MLCTYVCVFVCAHMICFAPPYWPLCAYVVDRTISLSVYSARKHAHTYNIDPYRVCIRLLGLMIRQSTNVSIYINKSMIISRSEQYIHIRIETQFSHNRKITQVISWIVRDTQDTQITLIHLQHQKCISRYQAEIY